MQDLLKQLLKLAEDMRLTHVQAEELGHNMSIDAVGELVHQIVACVLLISAEDPTKDYVHALLDEISHQADAYQWQFERSAKRAEHDDDDAETMPTSKKLAAIDSENQHNKAMLFLDAMTVITTVTGVHHGE